MINKLFLSGGGDQETTYEFDELFFCSLPLKANILYIPVAMASTVEKRKSCLDWFSKLVSSHESSERHYSFVIWNGDEDLPNLHNYSAIYVGGGNTYRLLAILQKTGMLESLLEYIKQGGIYYGGSAGAVISGRSLRTVEEENLENYINHLGMDMVRGFSIFPHFSNSDEQRGAIKNICVKNTLNIVAVPEGSGIVIEEANICVFGMASVYTQDDKVYECTHGDSLKNFVK